jgi:hypothetical protein
MSVGYAVICHCSITDDHSRVIIQENTSSDYINANYITLNIFYCSKRQKDKTQVKQLRQSSPITYISKYTIEHNDI